MLKSVRDSAVIDKMEKASLAANKDTLDRLEREFFQRCRTDRITVQQFYKSKLHLPDEAWLVAKYMERFEKLTETKLKLHGTGRPAYTLEETLEMFMEAHPPPKGVDCLKAMEDAGYGPCLV